MSTLRGRSLRQPTWFGAVAIIEFGGGRLHSAGFGRVLLPHPPLVNWLLRIGVAPHHARMLEMTHEFGHLQTLPIVLAYLAALLISSAASGALTFLGVLGSFVGALSVAEIAAEGYTVLSNRRCYADAYRGVSWIPRILFVGLSLCGLTPGWLGFFAN